MTSKYSVLFFLVSLLLLSCKKEGIDAGGYFRAEVNGESWQAATVETMLDLDGKTSYLYAKDENGSEIIFYMFGEITDSKVFKMANKMHVIHAKENEDGLSLTFIHFPGEDYLAYEVQRSEDDIEYTLVERVLTETLPDSHIVQVTVMDKNVGPVLELRPPEKIFFYRMKYIYEDGSSETTFPVYGRLFSPAVYKPAGGTSCAGRPGTFQITDLKEDEHHLKGYFEFSATDSIAGKTHAIHAGEFKKILY